MVTQNGQATRATIITLVSISILITLAILFLPSGFSNDVSKIGKGSKIAVFAYNNGTTNSMGMMNIMEQVRSSYSGKVEFLAVSISAPVGKKFLQDYNVEQSTLIMFSEDGSIVGVLNATNDKVLLRQTLDQFIEK